LLGRAWGPHGSAVRSVIVLVQDARASLRLLMRASCQVLQGSVPGPGHCAARAQVWDLKDLGLQAAQRVAAAPQPLAALREVAQGFVNLAPALSRERVSGALRAEVAQKQSSLQGGAGPA